MHSSWLGLFTKNKQCISWKEMFFSHLLCGISNNLPYCFPFSVLFLCHFCAASFSHLCSMISEVKPGFIWSSMAIMESLRLAQKADWQPSFPWLCILFPNNITCGKSGTLFLTALYSISYQLTKQGPSGLR